MQAELVHISQINVGDVIEHNGVAKTVSGNNLKRSEFMGITIFGDSYKLGSQKVKRLMKWR